MRLTKRAVVTSYIGSVSGIVNVVVVDECKRMIVKLHDDIAPNVGEQVTLFYDRSEHVWKIAA